MWLIKDEISLFPGRLLYGLNFSTVIYSCTICLIFQNQKCIEKDKSIRKPQKFSKVWKGLDTFLKLPHGPLCSEEILLLASCLLVRIAQIIIYMENYAVQ